MRNNKFTEEKFEQAEIELFEAKGYKHLTGNQIHKELAKLILIKNTQVSE